MKKIIFAILLIFIVACTTTEKVETDTTPDTVTEPVEPVEPVEPEPEPVVEPKEPETCESTLIPEDQQSITLESLKFTDDGFIIKFLPTTKDGKSIVPVTGNLRIIIHSTVEGENRVVESEVLRKGVYIKAENTQADCSPKEIEIKFDSYQNIDNKKYTYDVLEGDKGHLLIEFTRQGSSGEFFSDEYWPKEGESFLK